MSFHRIEIEGPDIFLVDSQSNSPPAEGAGFLPPAAGEVVVTSPPVNNDNSLLGFEGAEKKIEIDFKEDLSNPDGLRSLEQSHWEHILDLIRCQIVSKTSSHYFDSYVLSESSLFVYPFKVVLKTCGTTMLLRCLEPILAAAKDNLNLQPDFVFFSRKNFRYPNRQLHPHTAFDVEVEYLSNHFAGQAYVLGPVKSEHWFLYICDLREREIIDGDQTLEIMMTELDETVMQQFYRNYPGNTTAKDTTRTSGISNFFAWSHH